MSHLKLVREVVAKPQGLSVEQALIVGRRCVDILEAPPEAGEEYSDDEYARQMAATDRLINVFRVLDAHFSK